MKSRLSHFFLTVLAIAFVGVGTTYAQQDQEGTPAPQAQQGRGGRGAQQPGAPARFQPDAKSAQIIQQHSAILSSMSPVTDALLRNPPPGDWLQWRRTYDEQGFSPLAEVNKTNVSGLRTAWTWTLPAGTSQIVPLVHDGVMFVYGAGDHIQALNAVTGDLLWEFVYPAQSGPPWPGAAGSYRRNFAIYGDKLYFPTSNSHEVALDIKTGKLVWDHQMADIKLPYRASSGPLVVNGKVMQGLTNCSRLQPGGCFIVALDANTGNELWRFNTIPRPGEPGDKSWNGLPLEKRQGASVWSTGSYDPDLNLAYFATGNTYDWQDLVRGEAPGNKQKGVTADGLYTDSTLAIDPDTGKLKWYYQHLPEDVWDLDYAFEQTILTLPVNGKPEKLVVTTGKIEITDGVDAATGKWVFSNMQDGVQNIVKSIDPKTGKKIYNPDAIPDMTSQHSHLQCPGDNGGKDWPSNAYNPTTKILYITVTEDCVESVPRQFTAADPYTGGGQESGAARYQPGSDGNLGRVDAIDLSTQKTVWSTRQRAPLTSAALATAGGLVFAGDIDRWFKAYDDATGAVLWQLRLNDSLDSFPISYSVNGKQYIAVAAGFGGARIGSYRPLAPDVQLPRGGGAVMWVFELPDAPAK